VVPRPVVKAVALLLAHSKPDKTNNFADTLSPKMSRKININLYHARLGGSGGAVGTAKILTPRASFSGQLRGQPPGKGKPGGRARVLRNKAQDMYQDKYHVSAGIHSFSGSDEHTESWASGKRNARHMQKKTYMFQPRPRIRDGDRFRHRPAGGRPILQRHHWIIMITNVVALCGVLDKPNMYLR